MPMWTIARARKLIDVLTPILADYDWYCALAGGVLNEGSSDHDLDLVVVPYCWHPTRYDRRELYRGLREAGLVRTHSARRVRAGWRRRGRIDVKHVEVWSYRGRRVDIIVWPAPPDVRTMR